MVQRCGLCSSDLVQAAGQRTHQCDTNNRRSTLIQVKCIVKQAGMCPPFGLIDFSVGINIREVEFFGGRSHHGVEPSPANTDLGRIGGKCSKDEHLRWIAGSKGAEQFGQLHLKIFRIEELHAHKFPATKDRQLAQVYHGIDDRQRPDGAGHR